MASYKNHTCTGSVASVSDAVAALEELASECREIVDNAPEGLQQSDRIVAFEESASALESVSEPEVPSVAQDLTITYVEQRSSRKGRGESRAVRRDNALAVLTASQEAVSEWLEDEANEEHEERDDMEQLANDLDSIIGEVEGCEFPGMFG